jgi:hypothetical protein
MTTLRDIQDSINTGQVTGIIVEVTFPETEFGGVLVQMPSELPIQVVMKTGEGGQGADTPPLTGAVESVFGRTGEVVAVPGDYSLDQISPPEAAFILPGKMRIKADGSFQLWNPDQNKWHTLLCGGAAGGEYLTIGAGET